MKNENLQILAHKAVAEIVRNAVRDAATMQLDAQESTMMLSRRLLNDFSGDEIVGVLKPLRAITTISIKMPAGLGAIFWRLSVGAIAQAVEGIAAGMEAVQ